MKLLLHPNFPKKLLITIFSVLLFSFQFMFASHVSAQSCSVSGDTIVCENQISPYTAGNIGTYSYTWNAYGGTVVGAGTSVSVTWQSTGWGKVTLVIRDQLNQIVCTSIINVFVKPKPKPVIVPSYTVGCGITDPKGGGKPDQRDEVVCIKACDSTWVTYSVQNHPGSTYSWIITGAANYTPTITNSINVYWTGIGSGMVKVIETDSFGCVGEKEICIDIISKPHAAFTTLPAAIGGVVNVCKNQSIQFFNQSYAGAGTPLYTYEWIWGDGTSTMQNAPAPNATHSYSSAGTYIVQLVVQNECRCKDTFSIKVIVDNMSGPEIFCISTVCPDNTVTYHTNALCPTYKWTVSNGTILGDSTQSSVTVMWGSTGPGVITLSTPGCSGMCSSPTSVIVPIITPVSQIYGDTLVCFGEPVKYSIACNIPIDSIRWHLPANVSLWSGDTINSHEITVVFNSPFVSGNITVDYFHNVPGSTEGLHCGGTASLNVTARPKLFISGPSEICDNDPINFYQYPNVPGFIQWTITGSSNPPPMLILGNVPFIVPTWSFGPGLFNITAQSTSGQYCNDPQTITLKVNAAPPPPDSIKGPSPVCPNKPYTYIAFPSSSNFAIEWNVINGTPTTMGGTTISVMWGSTGPYILNAYQIDPLTGCKSLALSDTINSILPLTPAPIIGLDTVCSNSTVSYNTNVPGDNFAWSISPTIAGSVVSGQGTSNIGVEWNNFTGAATLTVIRTVCGLTISSSKTIIVIAPPAPLMSVPPTACKGTSVTMSSSTPAMSYSWNFGDAGTGSGASTSHIYNSTGNFVVNLTVTYSGTCSGTATASKSIMINPNPNITISTPDPNLFCGAVGTVNMFVAAPVTGTTYTWYKSPSTLLATGNSYSTNIIGGYYVIGVNSFGCSSTSNVIPIDTVCDTCKADPAYTNNFSTIKLGCDKDSFIGTYTAGAFNPTWNFDDPFSGSNFASGTNVSHTFIEPGFYRVNFCVNVPDITGTDTCQICRMSVDTIKYIPDFFDSLYCSGGGFNVKFINNTKRLSTLPIPSYAWLITPGSYTSTLANPIFALPSGTYTVSLTVNGTCVKTKTLVVPPMPQALFTLADSVCQGSPVAFVNSSIGYTQSKWYFGDGASSLITNPNRTYSVAGTYTASLVVSNLYGCSDSAFKNVVVMPNTLSGVIAPSDFTICEGDSILYKVTPAGGYPPYQYLWSSIASTQTIWAKYTGSYYVDLKDSKGCMFRTSPVNVMVNPVPRPEIHGKKHICINSFYKFSVNYPASGGYTINWKLLPDNATSSGLNTFNYNYFSPGSKVLYVKVTGPTGCVGNDSLHFSVHPNPIASIATVGNLCEGQVNQLIGSSVSPNIVQSFWNNGWNQDTLYTSVPDQYVYTVVDTFGCKASAAVNVNPLPDFCGYQSGCYEICDTVKELVWYAPKGYFSYQWYYNGSPITGAVNDTLHIPLYQSGTYQVEITTVSGCKAMSKPTDIKFVKCNKPDCVWKIEATVKCNRINPETGLMTYNITLNVYNGLGVGATLNVIPASGTISGSMPVTLAPNWNTISFTYNPSVPSATACFTLLQNFKDIRCDTSICITLPNCDLIPCKGEVKFEKFDCAGLDANGHPQYYACVNVNWGGSPGSTFTVNTPSGTVVPNTFTLNTGAQTFCFTFTDMPPYTSPSTFYFSFYDPKAEKACRDSLSIKHEPCKEPCKLETYNNCARCLSEEIGISTYELDITLYNPFATNASVTVLPIGAGTFGSVIPNPVAPGMQTIKITFTDNPPKDTLICFKVILTDLKGNKCMTELCMYLPPCDYLGVKQAGVQSASMKLAPNPANNSVAIYYNVSNGSKPLFEIMDMTGRKLMEVQSTSANGEVLVNLQDLAVGTYLVKLISDGNNLQIQRLVIVK